MIVVESYTKLISDTINTHLPNSSQSHNSHTDDGYYNYFSSSSSLSSVSYQQPPDTRTTTITMINTNANNNTNNSDDRSRLLVILRWIVHHGKMLYETYMEHYLKAHPIILGVLPLLIGLGLGFLLGWYCSSRSRSGSRNRSRNDAFATHKIDCVDDDEDALFDDGDYEEEEEDVDINEESEEEGEENNNNNDEKRDAKTRAYLKSSIHTSRKSTVPIQYLPKHIAVIMDGNRRYGKTKYNSIARGHWDGSKTLIDFSKWCIAEQIQIVTVYAFSTENWNRSKKEVNSLMKIFCKYCDELRVEAKERGICLRVLSTETDQIPSDVARGMHQMVEETKHNTKLVMNICLSYGSRGEITNACKSIAYDVQNGHIQPSDINEVTITQKMLSHPYPDPDLVIRTSGEYRLSNFLLWQLAYSEMFFIDKNWPELTKKDLVRVINSYVIDRKRRYGK